MKVVEVVLCLAAIAVAQMSPGSASTPEAAVRQADEAWAKAVASKSVERTVALYDAEAVTAGIMTPARGLAEIRAMWMDVFAQPDFFLTWKADKVVVIKSGTIAYSSGSWQMSGPNSTGQYLAVWRKQADGQWKVLIDSAWFTSMPK